MLLSGFFLGIANGIACLATCAAVLIPLFLGEGRRVRENGLLLAKFLAGRLAGYLLFGMLAWAANWVILRDAAARSVIFGVTYFILAGMMIAYGMGKLRLTCGVTPRDLRTRLGGYTWLRPWLPVIFGLLTGLNLCPPFLLAFTNAALNGTLVGSLAFFAAFFLGTSIYLLPVPLVGALRASFQTGQALQTVGKMAAVLMSLYYVYSGILLFLEGVVL